MKDNESTLMPLEEIKEYVTNLPGLFDHEDEYLVQEIFRHFFFAKKSHEDFLADAIKLCDRNKNVIWLEWQCRYVVRLIQLLEIIEDSKKK